MYYIEDENNVPQALTTAVAEGKIIQVQTVIGWVNIQEPFFICGNTYRIKEPK